MSNSLRDRLVAKTWYKWYALGVLTLVYASNQMDRQIMAILLEPIKLELNASDTQMGFLVGLTFALFYATLGMPIAMLADRKNRRNIITAAITVWSGMTVLCGYAGSFFQLALARIGVGVGEAGSTPPSHSIISDLFPVENRATAMGVFAVGVNIGLLLAYLLGGWLSDAYGWRFTFMALGLPGLLIAALLYFTVTEPRRGAADVISPLRAPPSPSPPTSMPEDTVEAPRFWAVAAHMWQTRSLRHTTIGASLAGFIGYGFVLWLPSFLVRSHGLSATEIGLGLALLTGIVGGFGTYTAGKLTDVLAARDIRWRAWLVAVASAGCVPLIVGAFIVQDIRLAFALYLVPAFLGGFYLAPTFALVQSLVGMRMRALAPAILLFVLNIIGMGFGPQMVGVMSDLLAPAYGEESLRMSLLILSLLNFWCAYHYFMAGRTLHDDLRAHELATASGV